MLSNTAWIMHTVQQMDNGPAESKRHFLRDLLENLEGCHFKAPQRRNSGTETGEDHVNFDILDNDEALMNQLSQLLDHMQKLRGKVLKDNHSEFYPHHKCPYLR